MDIGLEVHFRPDFMHFQNQLDFMLEVHFRPNILHFQNQVVKSGTSAIDI